MHEKEERIVPNRYGGFERKTVYDRFVETPHTSKTSPRGRQTSTATIGNAAKYVELLLVNDEARLATFTDEAEMFQNTATIANEVRTWQPPGSLHMPFRTSRHPTAPFRLLPFE